MLMGRGPKICTFFGVPTYIDHSWFLFTGFFTLVTAVSSGLPAAIETLTWIVMIFVAVLMHEYAHVWVGLREGQRVPQIVLMMFGGAAMFSNIPMGKKEFKIAIAGPICNLVLASLTWLCVVSIGWTPETIPTFVMAFLFGNGVLAAFNILPIFPMDGGRMVRSVVCIISKRPLFSTKFAVYTSWFVMPLAAYSLGFSLWVILIFAFMGLAGYQEMKMVALRHQR